MLNQVDTSFEIKFLDKKKLKKSERIFDIICYCSQISEISKRLFS